MYEFLPVYQLSLFIPHIARIFTWHEDAVSESVLRVCDSLAAFFEFNRGFNSCGKMYQMHILSDAAIWLCRNEVGHVLHTPKDTVV
jgi:hypothetical protein